MDFPLSSLVDTHDPGVSHHTISIGSQILLISMMDTPDMQGIQSIFLSIVDALLRGGNPSYDCAGEMSWVLGLD